MLAIDWMHDYEVCGGACGEDGHRAGEPHGTGLDLSAGQHLHEGVDAGGHGVRGEGQVEDHVEKPHGTGHYLSEQGGFGVCACGGGEAADVVGEDADACRGGFVGVARGSGGVWRVEIMEEVEVRG